VLTKADKLKRKELAESVHAYKKKLIESWEELPPLFVTSAAKKTGQDEVLDFIEKAMKGQL
jgi:GTP-binding protein